MGYHAPAKNEARSASRSAARLSHATRLFSAAGDALPLPLSSDAHLALASIRDFAGNEARGALGRSVDKGASTVPRTPGAVRMLAGRILLEARSLAFSAEGVALTCPGDPDGASPQDQVLDPAVALFENEVAVVVDALERYAGTLDRMAVV